jgi:cytochrome P450
MAADDHAAYSKLFRAAVCEASLRAAAPYAQAEITGALSALAAASRDDGAGVDPAPVITGATLRALLRLYFGGLLHAEDEPAIAAWLAAAAVGDATGRAAPSAVRALRAFEKRIAERAAPDDATDDPSIWGELLRLDPATAHDPTVAGNLFLLLAASEHSIGGLLRWMLVMLPRAPDWQARARAGTAGDDPYTHAVHETLRLAQSEYVYREVTAPIALDAYTIPKGWLLRICVAESHRQAAIFPNPDAFDPDRHRVRRYTVTELSPFGLDLHACLGARMTLLFGRILAEQLVTRFTCTVVQDGPRQRQNRHWHHWEPNARFRIHVEDRTPDA